MPTARIAADDPLAPDVVALLEEHLDDMRRISPPESVHALDSNALAAPGIVLLTARDEGGALLGCGALKDLGDGTGEVKAMRTATAARRRGVATAILQALIDVAQAAGFRRLSLETGTEGCFEPAVRLYVRHGFVPTEPFGSYLDDPHSRYLTLDLARA